MLSFLVATVTGLHDGFQEIDPGWGAKPITVAHATKILSGVLLLPKGTKTWYVGATEMGWLNSDFTETPRHVVRVTFVNARDRKKTVDVLQCRRTRLIESTLPLVSNSGMFDLPIRKPGYTFWFMRSKGIDAMFSAVKLSDDEYAQIRSLFKRSNLTLKDWYPGTDG